MIDNTSYLGQCQATDSRGVSWTADYQTWATQPCGQDMEGQALWFCNGCTGEFEGQEPDRMSCVDMWIGGLQDQVT